MPRLDMACLDSLLPNTGHIIKDAHKLFFSIVAQQSILFPGRAVNEETDGISR